MILRAGMLVAVLLSSAAQASLTTGFDRARWSLARGDTLTAVAHLDTTTGPTTRAVLLRLRLDPGTPPASSLPERAATWADVLRWSEDDELVGTGRAAESTLVLAAHALDSDDPATARALLATIDVPDRLRTLLLHLRIRALASISDPAVWSVRERLARSDAETDFDRRVVDEAAFALGLRALERGEDPGTWFDRVDPHGPLAAWVDLVGALHGDDGTLASWLERHPDHPTRFDAQLHHAAGRLAAGRDSTARALYLELEGLLDAEAASLTVIADDSTHFASWAATRWAEATATHIPADTATWSRALDRLDEALLEPGRDLPPAEDWLRVDEAAPWSSGVPRLPVAALRRDRSLADSVAVAARALRHARHRLEGVTADLARRDAHLGRGARRLDELREQLRDANATLRALDAEIPRNLADLQVLEDSLLARLDTRAQALAQRAAAQARRARTLGRWYGRGPMARRDPPPDPRVPVPAHHLDAEAAWADSARVTVTRFADDTRQSVQRSFAEVFAGRFGDGVTSQWARADSLRDRAERASRTLDTARVALGADSGLADARAAVDAARARHAARVDRLEEARLTAARRLLARLRDRQQRHREAVAYGAAVATTNLARAGDAHLRDEARERWAAFVEAGCDPLVRGDARYRWADLELATARADFRASMQDWLEHEDAGSRALAPLLDIEPALALFRTILDEDQLFARRDLVLLHLGMLQADRGDPEARRHLTRLVDDFPDSPLVDVAQLRLGEIAFENGDHDTALPPLRVASRSSDPEIQAVALYQRAWSAHVTGRGIESIDTLRRLLDLHAGPGAPTAFDLGPEARALYLRTLARAGGAPAFLAAVERNGPRDDDVALLDDLSALLSDYALLEQAAAVDRLLLRRHPLAPEAFGAARRWIANTAATDEDEVLAVAGRFVPGDAWHEAQVDASLRAEAATFARDVIVGVASRRHEAARDAADVAAKWQAALELHRRSIHTWPDDRRSVKWRTLAGECELALGRHAAAIHDFVTAARDTSRTGDDAAWRAVTTADAWYRSNLEDDRTTGPDSLAHHFLELADTFRSRISDPERAVDLDWRTLRLEAAHGRDDRVVVRARDFVERHPDDPRVVEAARTRAQALYRMEAYDRASSAFRSAASTARAAGRDSLAHELGDWAPHAYELHVESVEADTTRGPATAANLWRQLAMQWPETEHAERALYRSGVAHAAVGRDSLAIDAWTTLIEAHSDADLVPDAYRNVARTYEDSGDLGAAARTLVAYANAFAGSEDAGNAWLRAVDLHERRGDRSSRERLLDIYLERHPNDRQTLQAVRERRARAELDDGTAADAVDAYLEFAAAHPGRASDELLAAIGFHRADSGWNGFVAVELTQPLPASIARKRDRLQDLIAAYRGVIEREVAPWTQAATQRLGEALLHMGDAIQQSERPAGLQGDDRLAYEDVLEEQAWTFHERGESTLRELLLHHEPGADPAATPWIARARSTLFPRIARRFLHQPSFEYPIIDETTNDDDRTGSATTGHTRNDSRFEAPDLLTEDR